MPQRLLAEYDWQPIGLRASSCLLQWRASERAANKEERIMSWVGRTGLGDLFSRMKLNQLQLQLLELREVDAFDSALSALLNVVQLGSSSSSLHQ
jgi:hypothetical protein